MVNLTSLLFVVLLSSTYYVESGSAIESIECEFCKKIFTYVYNLLDEDRAIKSIENALDSVCDQMFPGDQAATCEDYVAKYTTTIVDLIVKTTDPDQACTMLQLCNASAESRSLLELIAGKIQTQATIHIDGDRCNECLKDIDALRSDLKLARNEHIAKLQQCCGQFPTPDGLCDSYINTINPIYDTLDSKIVPEACGTFGVCPSKLTTAQKVKRSTVDEIEPDCLLCERVFKLVDQVIEKQAKHNIEAALDKVCDKILPSSAAKKCRKYVDTYTTQLINFITKHTDPDEACQIMGMCKQQLEVEENLISLTSELNPITTTIVSSSDECDNCNKSVGWAAVTVEGYLTSLNAELENTCLDYTKNYDFCKSYMADHFNSDTNELITKTSSGYFCINIFGLCK